MTAQEMFDDLGFCQIETEFLTHYDNVFEECDVFFYKDDKSFCVTDFDGYTINISMPLFKAIQKQLEELGWIDV